MDRREFLRMIGLAPVAAAAVALPAAAPATGGFIQGPFGEALLGESAEALLPLSRLAPVTKLSSGEWGLRQVAGRSVFFGRISVEPDDREANHALGVMKADLMKPRIFLDGIEQTGAVMADSEAGVIRRALISPYGRPVIDPSGEEVMIEEVRGEVIIEAAFPDEPEPSSFPT